MCVLIIRPGKGPQGLRPPCHRRDSSSYQFDHQPGSLLHHSVLPDLKEADAAGAGGWPQCHERSVCPWLGSSKRVPQTTRQRAEPWRSPARSSAVTAAEAHHIHIGDAFLQSLPWTLLSRADLQGWLLPPEARSTRLGENQNNEKLEDFGDEVRDSHCSEDKKNTV